MLRHGEPDDIHYVTPANDDASTKFRLATRCGPFLRRLIALHGLSRPVSLEL